MANEVDTTLLDNLNSIKNSKADIKQALIDKGQNPTNVFADYAQLISDIQTGEDLSEELSAQEAKLAQLESILDNKTAGGKVKLNIFMQETEPEIKNGIWLQSNKSFNKVISKENISIEPSYSVYVSDKIGNSANVALPSWIKEKGYEYLFTYFNPSSSEIGAFFLIAKDKFSISYPNSYTMTATCNGGIAGFYIGTKFQNTVNKIRDVQESSLTFNTSFDMGNPDNYKKWYSTSFDVYDTTGNIRYKAPELDSFDSNSIVIVQEDLSYKTIIVETDIENGLIFNFSNVVFSDENSKVDTTIPTYYGDGTQWIKFKN